MPTPDPSTRAISTALERFLHRSPLHHLHFASPPAPSAPPPQLAYLVNFPRLSLVLSGQDDMSIAARGQIQTLRLKPGDAVFIPANCWNHPAWRFKITLLTFLFGKRQTGVSLVRHPPCSRSTSSPSLAIKAHFPGHADQLTCGILESLLQLAPMSPPESRSPTDRLLAQALLHRCLQLLLQPHPHGKASRTFHTLCLYLQENFQLPLTRDSVAEHFDLSPNHLSRIFRTQGLMKFTDYLTWVRLDRAKYLLRHHPGPIASLSSKCGFPDPGYFCRVFKRKVKMTPTDYRSQTI